MDMNMDEAWEEYEDMPFMEEAKWEMPENMNWDELSDPEFYQEQGQEWRENMDDWDLVDQGQEWRENMEWDLVDQAQEWTEEKDWDALADPEFYQNQAEEWAYAPMIAESGITVDFNNTGSAVSWDQEQMRDAFRENYGWAIMGDIWDSREPSTCADRCN